MFRLILEVFVSPSNKSLGSRKIRLESDEYIQEYHS